MVQGAYDYLENRITDHCQGPYHCSGPYEVCRVSQLFDPSFVAANLTAAAVDELCDAIPPLSEKANLKSELEAYKTAATAAPAMDHSNVKAFTEPSHTQSRTGDWSPTIASGTESQAP